MRNNPAYAHLLLPDSPLDRATNDDTEAMQQLVHLMEACYNNGYAAAKKVIVTHFDEVVKEEITFDELKKILEE
jgi:hypothetical protein